MNYSLIILLLCLSLFAVQSGAQANALTLQDVLDLADKHHPLIAEAKANIAAAEARARTMGALPNPEGIARVESAPVNGPTTRNAEYLAGVSQTLPLGPRLARARRLELAERERLTHQLTLKRKDIHRQVHSAFATALFQEKAYLTQNELASNALRIVAITKARVEAGDAVPVDLARAELEQANTRLEADKAKTLRGHALLALAGAIGDPQLSIESLDGSLESAWNIPELEELVRNLAAHPAIAAMEADLTAQRSRLDLSRAERIPDIRLDLLYRRLQAERRDAFDFGVALPIPVWNRNSDRIREAQHSVEAAEARAKSTANDLNLRLRETHSRLASALSTARTFQSEILPRAKVIVKQSQDRYNQGDLSLSDLILIRREFAQFQMTHLELLRDVMQLWAELRLLSK